MCLLRLLVNCVLLRLWEKWFEQVTSNLKVHGLNVITCSFLQILFACAEALYAHGYSNEACRLTVELARDLLANPPDLKVEQPPTKVVNTYLVLWMEGKAEERCGMGTAAFLGISYILWFRALWWCCHWAELLWVSLTYLIAVHLWGNIKEKKCKRLFSTSLNF